MKIKIYRTGSLPIVLYGRAKDRAECVQEQGAEEDIWGINL